MQSTLRALGTATVVAACLATAIQAQPIPTAFKARLTPVPVETSTSASITGSGLVTATLAGSTLSVTGTFTGMKSAATIAQVHFGPKGIRGPVEFGLMVDNVPAGTISGSVTLTKVQIDSLRKGWFYIQIHAEKAPDGNLWGWLLLNEK
jgi:hypothetical protein